MKYYLAEMKNSFIRSLCVEDYGHPYFIWIINGNEAGDVLAPVQGDHSVFNSPFRKDFLMFVEQKFLSHDKKTDWKIIEEFEEFKQIPDFIIKNNNLNNHHKAALLKEIALVL